MRIHTIVALGIAALAMTRGVAAEEASDTKAYKPMAIFAALAGTAWRGEGTGPDGNPIVDVVQYEMILDGRAFQSTHRLEGGTYGGRTVFFYDEGAKKYVYHYFTTAGFHTTGELEPTETGFKAMEKVNGHATIAEVHSEFVIDDDVMRVVSSHLDGDGNKATEGDSLVYREIDDPGPLFGAQP